METVDAYLRIIPPGSRSGRHRHLAEECRYVLEGHGYDLHQDCDVVITDTYTWKPADEVQRVEWQAGDRQCGLNDFEQLEDAPEYDPSVTLDAATIRRYLVPARTAVMSGNGSAPSVTWAWVPFGSPDRAR